MKKDVTQGSILRAIWILSLPGSGTHLLLSGRGLLDAYWIGRLGSEALAALSMASSLGMIASAITMGITTAGSAMLARAIGAREDRRGGRAFLQTLGLLSLILAVVSAIGYFWAEPLLRMLGARDEVLSLGVQWMQVYFAGILAMELFQGIDQLFYGSGDPDKVFYANVAFILSLAVLDPLLIVGWGQWPGLGIKGAALAHILSAIIGCGVQLFFLLTRRSGVALHKQDFRFEPTVVKRVLKLALPVVVTRVVTSLTSPLSYRIVASYGVAVVAGYGVASKIFNFAFTLAAGFAMSPRSTVGQNLGAGQPKRAEKSVWLATAISAALTGIQMGAIMIFARPIISFFDATPEVVAEGSRCLLYLGMPQVPFIVTFCLTTALNGAGDTKSPMWINIGTRWLLQLPLMYGLSHLLGLGAPGIWLGIGISDVIQAVVLVSRFAQGKWKEMRV